MNRQDEEKKILPSDSLKFSFTITYILLITTGTITIIEALRNKDPLVRHILNLETAVSIIAGFFYSKFVSDIAMKDRPINWQDIMKTRYTDWFITTPIMLLALILALTQKLDIKPAFSIYALIVLLNFAMLFLGYLGETGKVSKNMGMYGGFVPFILMYGLIFFQFVFGRGNVFNYVLFFINFVIWAMYGVIYKMEDKKKNIIYNGLDLTAKCFIGLGLWVYFTGIFEE